MSNREAFVKSYNHFDGRPLVGNTLRDFYIDDFCKTSVKEIATTVEISEQYRKMLLIGHRGCGKSTILNKLAEELQVQYHVVSFSASEELNMMDVETVDILLATYLQLLKSLDKNWLERLLEKDKTIKNFIDSLNNSLKLDVSIKDIDLKILAFKFKVEDESRATMRRSLYGQITELLDNIGKVCNEIENQKNKTILIIIDDLDKLQTNFAEKIFFENQLLLTMPKVKVIYTFPLDTYYCADYIRISDRYKKRGSQKEGVSKKRGPGLAILHLHLTYVILQDLTPIFLHLHLTYVILQDLTPIFLHLHLTYVILQDLTPIFCI